MAKKTEKVPAASVSAPKRLGRPKAVNPKPPTPIVMTIRAKPEWEAWIDELCEKLRKNAKVKAKIDRTAAVDIALDHLASSLGMADAPPRY